jgi:hypothetical protein
MRSGTLTRSLDLAACGRVTSAQRAAESQSGTGEGQGDPPRPGGPRRTVNFNFWQLTFRVLLYFALPVSETESQCRLSLPGSTCVGVYRTVRYSLSPVRVSAVSATTTYIRASNARDSREKADPV